MNVGQVIELAKEWVEVHGSQTPGFCGAHLMGGLNLMPKDVPFPAYKDADLNIVLKDGPRRESQNILYKGLLMEYGSFSAERYRSPEVVLSDPALACHLAVDSILSDPTGRLAALHSAVARAYPRRKWVLARCASAKERARRGLVGISQAGSPVEAIFHGIALLAGLTGLIAVTKLKPPTYRRCLILTRELLEKEGRVALQEEILDVWGYAHLTRAQVAAYLQDCTETFDRAVRITRTPVPFGYKLRAHLRPYVVEGAQEMIDEGYHREAMFWVGGFLIIANGAIQVDAPEEEKPHFQTKVDRLLSDLRWRTHDDVRSRLQQAKALADKVFRVADDIVSRSPEIGD